MIGHASKSVKQNTPSIPHILDLALKIFLALEGTHRLQGFHLISGLLFFKQNKFPTQNISYSIIYYLIFRIFDVIYL